MKWRQAIEVAGFGLVAFAGWFIHPAVSIAVAGASAIWLANYADWGDNDA